MSTRPRPFRWIETATGASGIRIYQRSAGVGMSSRIPATMTISAVLTNSGERVTSLNVGGANKADLQRLLAKGDAIQRGEIASWFRSDWLLPKDSELQELELALNIMRVTVRAGDTAAIVRGDVKTNIAALLPNLAELIKLQRQDFELAAGGFQQGLTVLKAYDDLFAAAQQADKFLGRPAPRTRVARK